MVCESFGDTQMELVYKSQQHLQMSHALVTFVRKENTYSVVLVPVVGLAACSTQIALRSPEIEWKFVVFSSQRVQNEL